MSHNYDGAFGSTDDEAQIFDIAVSGDVANRYGRGSHTVRNETNPSDLRTDAKAYRGIDDQAADLLEKAADIYEGGANISAYECPECGLRHSHSRNKHVLTASGVSALSVRSEFADAMVFNKRCHCGVNELAMLLRFADNISMQIFADIENDDLPRPEVVSAAEKLRDPHTDRDELIDELGADIVADAVEYSDSPALSRVLEVRDAADSAPISAETRERIESIESELADEIDKDPLTEAFEEYAMYHGQARDLNEEQADRVAREMWRDLFGDGHNFRLSDVREYINNRLGR